MGLWRRWRDVTADVLGVGTLIICLLGPVSPALAQRDLDADSRALVQRLTLDRAATIVVIQKKADDREQELFAQLEAKNSRLRARELALRRESQRRAAAESELKAIAGELAEITRQRQDAVNALAARDRQFAIEIEEYRRQMASIAGSPDPRKRAALAAYAEGDRKGAFAVLVDIQKAETRAVAAGWLELSLLALDMKDRGELATADVIGIYEQAQRLSPEWQWGWIELAHQYHDAGRLKDATRAASEAVARATDDRSRAAATATVGVMRWAAGDLTGARGRFEESLAIFRRLAASNPRSVEAQQDLSVILGRLGDAMADAGDLVAARRYYEENVAIARRISAANPSDLEAERDVGLALERLGNLLAEAGDLTAARAHLDENLAIARRAAAVKPSSAEVQRDLGGALVRVGEVVRPGRRPGDRSIAL